MLTFRGLLNAERKEVIRMRQFFYAMARHGVMLRVLFVLTVMAAIAIAGAAPDCVGP